MASDKDNLIQKINNSKGSNIFLKSFSVSLKDTQNTDNQRQKKVSFGTCH